MIPQVMQIGERMSLCLYPTEQFKAGTLSVSVVLPIERKSAYLTSLLWSVLLRGTEAYPTVSDINRRLDYLYGTELSVRNFYRGDCHIVGLSANLLGDSFLQAGEEKTLPRDVLAVMEQILFHPVLDKNGLLDETYVESEKKLQCETVRAQKNQPHAYAGDRLRALMYENEPAGVAIYGCEEEVMAVTPRMLTAHWREMLSRLQLSFFAVGGMDGTRLREAIWEIFGASMKAACEPPLSVTPCTSQTVKRELRRVEEGLPIGQGHLMIGLRTDCTVRDDGFFACTVFNEMLGLSPVSRLFLNVREKLSLCYSCSSRYNAYKGAIQISCALENGNRERAEEEIFRQIEALAAGNFDEEELAAAKRSLCNAYRQLEDSATAIENYYFGRALAGVSLSPHECRERLLRVTREDVMAAAAACRTDTVFFLRADAPQCDGGEECADEDQ